MGTGGTGERERVGGVVGKGTGEKREKRNNII